MTIDKSIRQWYDSGSLVRKGPPGTRPGFRYGPHSDPSPAPSAPSGGHHRDAPTRSVSAPAPAPAPSPHRDPAPAPAPDRQDRAREQAAIEQAIKETKTDWITKKDPEPIINIPSNEELLKTGILQGPELPITTGEGMIAGPIQGVISQPNIPITSGGGPDVIPAFVPRKTTTVTGGNPFVEDPIQKIVYQPTDLPKRTYDPRTDPNALLQRGSGIMGTVKDKSVQMAKDFATRKAMKALGLTALNPVLGIGSWLLDKFAPGKKAALKSNITNLLTSKSDDLVGTPDWQGEKKRNKTFHEGKGDGQQETTVQEAIAGKTSLGADALGLPELQKRMAMLHQLKQNEDFWNQLTDVQKRNINMAMMNYFKMIDQYSVKPDEGRRRDIG